MPSGRPKGGKNRYWSAQDKEKIVLECIEKGYGSSRASKIFGISKGQHYKWMRAYREQGLEGLENKRKPGNPLVKYSRKKILTKEEQLEYENMKLIIENERLKKGYLIRGDGQIVVFDKRKFRSSK